MDVRIVDVKHNESDGTVTMTVTRDAFRMLGNGLPVAMDYWYDKSRDDNVTIGRVERDIDRSIFQNYQALDNRMRELRLQLGI